MAISMPRDTKFLLQIRSICPACSRKRKRNSWFARCTRPHGAQAKAVRRMGLARIALGYTLTESGIGSSEERYAH